VLYLAIAARLVQLHAYPVEIDEEQRLRVNGTMKLLPYRGRILDRFGRVLAYDRPSSRLELNYKWQHRRYHPARIEDAEWTEQQIREEIEEVARACKLDADSLEEMVRNPQAALAPIRWNIDPFEAARIQGVLDQFPGFGLGLVESRTREYPVGRATGQLVGLILQRELDDPPTTGLEKYGNEQLTGELGTKQSLPVSRFFGVNPSRAMNVPVDGRDLVTTLDSALQIKTREVLAPALDKYQPDWLGAVVMDVETGAILSMVSLPDLDPNCLSIDETTGLDANGVPSSHHLKMTDSVVPGSTFKPFFVAWALQHGVIGKEQIFEDPGWIRPKGRRTTIHNASMVPNGPKTPREALIHSSNVVCVQIGEQLGVDRVREMLDVFEFTKRVDLPGHRMTRGILPGDDQWTPLRKARAYAVPSLSFGHGLMVNPVRYLASLSSLVNGGMRIEPHLIPSNYRASEDRLIDEHVSDYVRESMGTMVERRIGKPLPEIAGVQWGGKSGSARNEANKELYQLSFFAFAPVEKPKYAVFVTMVHPRDQKKPSGTSDTGPLAGDILAHALRLNGYTAPSVPGNLDSTLANANVESIREPR